MPPKWQHLMISWTVPGIHLYVLRDSDMLKSYPTNIISTVNDKVRLETTFSKMIGSSQNLSLCIAVNVKFVTSKFNCSSATNWIWQVQKAKLLLKPWSAHCHTGWWLLFQLWPNCICLDWPQNKSPANLVSEGVKMSQGVKNLGLHHYVLPSTVYVG